MHVNINYIKVVRYLKDTSVHKACGMDQISANFIKFAASVIANHICAIINRSIAQSEFPKLWKTALVKPLFKKGGKHEHVASYRPISVLCILSKILEKHVHSHFYSYLCDKQLLHSCQSGFRPKHSTQTCLIKMTNKWLNEIDKGNVIGCVAVDMSKAFDSLSHATLLSKLSLYGCNATTVKWFESYLCDRVQHVSIGNQVSEGKTVRYGVPQGSVLGPLLFCLYINDLPLVINNCDIDMYADDVTLYTAKQSVSSLENCFNIDLPCLVKWCTANHLLINAGKTQTTIICSSQKQRHLEQQQMHLKMQNVCLGNKDTLEILGLNIDNHLSWREHIDCICAKIASKLGLMYRLRPYVNEHMLRIFYNSYILPHIDGCLNIYGQASNVHLKKIQTLQNRAARLVLQADWYSHGQDLLNELQWMNVKQRTYYNMGVLMFKIFNNLVPDYLHVFSKQTHHYGLRSHDQYALYLNQEQICVSSRLLIKALRYGIVCRLS